MTGATATERMTIDRRFSPVAERFFAMFDRPVQGGGALTAYLHGEKVLDVWSGWSARNKQWTADTVALSFSTGKGVASTVLHRLVDRGLLGYDDFVAEHWPEFAAAGKGSITVRELMSHRAGLHRVLGLLPGPLALLDTDNVATALAAAPPDPRRQLGPGYHAVTYGSLVAELAQRVTGRPFGELVTDEVAAPLGAPELWFQVPPEARPRMARTFPRINPVPGSWETAGRLMTRVPGVRGIAEAGMPEGFDELVRNPAAHDVAMPGWNGVFTARALARMYVPLAGGGRVDGTTYLEPETVEQLLEVQTRRRDYVLGIRPYWRLGYHPAWLRLSEQPRRSVGHYGFGGSGAFADPETGLTFGFTSNRLGSRVTPVSDLRLPTLGAAAVQVARRLA